MKFLIRFSLAIFILFVSLLNLKSQSLEFATPPEDIINSHPDSSEIKSYAVVRNKSVNSVNIKAKMTVLSIKEGHLVYFCLGNCYPPRINDFEMPDGDAVTLAPDETTTGAKFFDVVLIPDGIEGVTIVKMTFTVVGNPSDFVEYTVTFNATTPVIETEEPSIVFAEPMPNPATDYITFSFNLPEGQGTGLLEIYNSTGKQIDRLNLNEQKIKKYNTALLPSGIYYAVMNIQDENKAVRKFVVLH